MLSTILFAAAVALGEPRGTLEGRVVEQAGKGTKPAAHHMVQLKIYKDKFQVAGARSKTDTNGRYSFKGLQTNSAYFYEPIVPVDEIPFSVDPVQFDSASTLRTKDIVITPVTGKTNGISMEEVILVEFGKMDLLKVSHSLTFENEGPDTYDYRIKNSDPIRLTLPEQGFNLSFGDGLNEENVDLTDQKNLNLKLHLQPGESNAQRAEFSYTLPYSTSSIAFALQANIKTAKAALALVNRKLNVESTIIKFDQEKEREGKKYFLYTGGPIPANQPLKFAIKGLPRSSDTGHRLLMGGAALIAVIAFLLAFKKKETVPLVPKDARKRLMIELSEIEKRFQQGYITPQEYREERERLRELLFDLEVA